MTKTNVSNWIFNDNARNLDGQIKYAIACECEGYLNGINDCGTEEYPSMTFEGWVNYIVVGLKIAMGDYLNVNGLDYRHLQFTGDKKIRELAEIYVANYTHIQKYILR